MIDETARVAARRQCMPQRTTDHIRHHLTHRVPPHATPLASTVLVTVERRLPATRTDLCGSRSPPSLPGWEHASRTSGSNDSYRRDSGTRRLGDPGTRGPGDPETRRHGDTETRGFGQSVRRLPESRVMAISGAQCARGVLTPGQARRRAGAMMTFSVAGRRRHTGASPVQAGEIPERP